jgi:acetyl esterase
MATPLDSQLADILDRIKRAKHPSFWQLDVDAARTAYRNSARILEIAAAELARVDNFSIRARDRYELPVRLYVPGAQAADKGAPAPPLIVYFHGGGFTIGDLETHDAICRMLASKSDALVFAVDYRLAPEHPFPQAVEDAEDALVWAHANARRLGADATRIAVVGDSAGGTLATVTARLARAHGFTPLVQVMVYPGTAGYQGSASHQRLAQGYLLDQPTIQWFFGHYLRDASDRDDWRFAPLTGTGGPPLAEAPPAVVLVAGFDPLHDEGVEYAHALEAAGVETTLIDYPGMVHGFFNFGRVLDVARRAHDDVVRALRERFYGEGRADES